MLVGYAVFILGFGLVAIGECCTSSKPNYQSLFEAVKENDNSAVTALLLSEAKVDSRDNTEWELTALMNASYYGYNEIVFTLLTHNASVDIQDYAIGKTALMYAAEHGHNDVVSIY